MFESERKRKTNSISSWETGEKGLVEDVYSSLEKRVERSILGQGGSSRPGTQLEIKARAESGDTPTSWMCLVAEHRDSQERLEPDWVPCYLG